MSNRDIDTSPPSSTWNAERDWPLRRAQSAKKTMRCLRQTSNQGKRSSILLVRYDRANDAKCGDGIPCENCKRTGRLCTISTRPTILVPVFVGEKTKVTSKVTRSASAREDRTVIHLPRSVELTHADRAFPHFFVAFLPMNVLMNKSVEAEMLAMAKSSPALRDAVQAIATLHRQQQDQLNMVPADDRCETYHALQAYGRSVRYIQSRIMSADFLSDPTALWATFLLGLFEVRSR